MIREPISCKSFAAREERVFKRAVFNLAAYIGNNAVYTMKIPQKVKDSNSLLKQDWTILLKSVWQENMVLKVQFNSRKVKWWFFFPKHFCRSLLYMPNSRSYYLTWQSWSNVWLIVHMKTFLTFRRPWSSPEYILPYYMKF